jgi:putative transposase
VARRYHTVSKQGVSSEKQLADFLVRNGQQLLPMVELIEQSRMAVEELIDCVGRVTIQAVLRASAEQVAGPRQQGMAKDREILWYGKQGGSVYLREGKLAVERPRLRRRGRGRGKEVVVPAYAAMQDRAGMQTRMLEILLNGVSTRKYQEIIPRLADRVGVAKSSVSRESMVASEAALKELLERPLGDQEILVIYIDGIHCGERCVIGAVGVDDKGYKTVLGIQEGATENAAACKELLENLVARGLDTGRRRLFVIDGSKALRSAINAVFGQHHPVQRCRHHKLSNVIERLPKDQQDQMRSAIRAAWNMNAKEGMARLRKLAEWLQRDYPDAAASLLEGLEECFTINRLDLPPTLHRCLATTNVIESSQSGVRMRTRRICRWRASMPRRWVAAAFLETEKQFHRIMGYRELWALKAILQGETTKVKERIA